MNEYVTHKYGACIYTVCSSAIWFIWCNIWTTQCLLNMAHLYVLSCILVWLELGPQELWRWRWRSWNGSAASKGKSSLGFLPQAFKRLQRAAVSLRCSHRVLYLFDGFYKCISVLPHVFVCVRVHQRFSIGCS